MNNLKKIYESKELFSLWDYSPSHSQLLLRHTRDLSYENNVDITFIGVAYAELICTYNNLIIYEVINYSNFNRINQLTKAMLYNRKVYLILSNEIEYLIVAWGYEINENNLHPFESSLDRIQPILPIDK